jgi:5'-nucleotidase
MDRQPERVALIDMDGTLADLDLAMAEQLAALASPGEPSGEGTKWLKARKALIKNQPGFWRNLPRLEEGFRVLGAIKEVGFSLNVLTKGPFKTTTAWSQKVEWCREHLGDTPVTITEHKGLSYGRVLFDDWPPYITDWLVWRPRGLVVMLGHPWNQGFRHPNVVRIDRANFDADLEVARTRLQEAYDR